MIKNTPASTTVKLAAIVILTPPNKTAYHPGEALDTTGMVVQAQYTNGKKLTIGGYTVSPQVMAMGVTSVTVSYTEAGYTKTATQAVTVSKIKVTVPTVSGSLTYNGSSQSPTIQNEPSTAIATRGGTASATNAGSYAKTYTLVDTTNYEWATAWNGSLAWSIAKVTPTVVTPTKAGTMTYNGSARNLLTANGATNYGTLQYKVNSGAWSATPPTATNAGTYAVSYQVVGDGNVNSVAAASLGNVAINQATGTLTVSKTGVSLTSAARTATFTIGGNYDGALTVTSSNTAVATVSRSGATVTVTAVSSGSATVTVSAAAGTNYTAPASKTVSVSVSLFTSPLNTSNPTLGDHTVYFTAHPSVKWEVEHIDGSYVYLALYSTNNMPKIANDRGPYSGSGRASACTNFGNHIIPNALPYCESVTVKGVTGKLFLPSYSQMTSEWDWPKGGSARLNSGVDSWANINNCYWLSTDYNTTDVYCVQIWTGSPRVTTQNITDGGTEYGARPAVKVRFKE